MFLVVPETASPTFQRGFPQLWQTRGMILTKVLVCIFSVLQFSNQKSFSNWFAQNLNKNYLGWGCFLHAVKRIFCAGSHQNLCTIPVPQLWDLFLETLGSFTQGAAPCCARSTCLGKQAFRVYFSVTLQVLLTPPNAGTGRGSPGLCWRHQGQLFLGMFSAPMQGKNICRGRLLCPSAPGSALWSHKPGSQNSSCWESCKVTHPVGNVLSPCPPLLWDLIPIPGLSQDH